MLEKGGYKEADKERGVIPNSELGKELVGGIVVKDGVQEGGIGVDKGSGTGQGGALATGGMS